MLDWTLRILVGANFLFFGLNGFFYWVGIPQAEPRMKDFVGALERTGYLMLVVKSLEVVCGAFILTGFLVPLALILLAPIVFVIISAQLVLNGRRGWSISALTGLPFLGLLFLHQDAYLTLFKT
ncbi:MAG: DoxX family membrane protein [Bdellovibrio sp.]|jgi:putative oxidoreductase